MSSGEQPRGMEVVPFLNTYRTMCMAPDEALLAVLAGVRQMQLSQQFADN